jgi:23S rRNA (adenine2503-C2)-methyltransferase
MNPEASHPEHFPAPRGASGGRLESENVLGMTSAQYADAAAAHRLPYGRAGAMERYARLFREGGASWAGALRDGAPDLAVAPIVRTHASECEEGRVLKFTQSVAGRRPGDPALETESVVIPMIGRKGRRTYTLCVSSQVGCAMGCVFCQTAQMGLVRSLTPAEIVGQWFAARHVVLADPAHGLDPDAPITNVVFMGMGEPLDNIDNVLSAIGVLTDHRAVELPMSKVTISTVGRIDGIEQLAAKVHEPGWHRIGLAVSLNAPNDEIRSRIMPVNRAMPLRDLRAALVRWPIYGGFKFCFEYVLIPGVNDARAHASQLGDFVLGRREHAGSRLAGLVNVIPYNPRESSPWGAPVEEDVDRFVAWCRDEGMYVKRRRTKGRDTMAACGQLGNLAYRRKPTRPVALRVAPW